MLNDQIGSIASDGFCGLISGTSIGELDIINRYRTKHNLIAGKPPFELTRPCSMCFSHPSRPVGPCSCVSAFRVAMKRELLEYECGRDGQIENYRGTTYASYVESFAPA